MFLKFKHIFHFCPSFWTSTQIWYFKCLRGVFLYYTVVRLGIKQSYLANNPPLGASPTPPLSWGLLSGTKWNMVETHKWFIPNLYYFYNLDSPFDHWLYFFCGCLMHYITIINSSITTNVLGESCGIFYYLSYSFLSQQYLWCFILLLFTNRSFKNNINIYQKNKHTSRYPGVKINLLQLFWLHP